MSGSGKFTFVLTEREVSAMLDALDAAVEQPPAGSTFGRDYFADLAGMVNVRLSW